MIEHIRVICLFLIRMILYLIPDTNENGPLISRNNPLAQRDA